MAELDELLSATLERVAEPGDPAGVADAIRSRIAAGDSGTPAGSSGFGGGGPLSWLPWIGVVVMAGVAGGAVGASGVLIPPAAEPVLSMGTLGNAVTATGCPGGVGVVELNRGTRVLAVSRSDDSAYLGVRDPLEVRRTVWLPVSAVLVDEGQPAINTLPVSGCPVPTLLAETPAPAPTPTPTPTPTATQAPAPQPPQPPQPPSDTTAPSLGQASGTPNPFYNAEPITLTASASDNVGVAAVLISWSGPGVVSSSSSMNNVGGNQWQYVFSTSAQVYGSVTFTMVAVDGTGNQSPPVNVVTSHLFFG